MTSSIIKFKIDLSMKIKHAIVNQITEPTKVQVTWIRGKRNLESSPGTIDPGTHQANIDDVFKMKTELEFDSEKYKFEPKISVLELQFVETKDTIGHIEFDLGHYANRVRDKTVKLTLDLKSDKYPGSQIYIYINVSLLPGQKLPERISGVKPPIDNSPIPDGRKEYDEPQDIAGSIINYDLNENRFNIEMKELENKKYDLEKEKIKLEQEHEKLRFFKGQIDMEHVDDTKELLYQKDKTLDKCRKSIVKYSKQEKIIISVLDILNQKENENMFQQSDADLTRKLDDKQKQYEDKQQEFNEYKRMKDNFSDLDYFIDNAYF